jgi:hypothetical protein
MKCEECDSPWSVRMDRGQDEKKTTWLCHECITIKYGQLVIINQ